MTAQEAYNIVKKSAFDGYSAQSCKEYNDFFMFSYGGAFVLCVDKKSGKVTESSRWEMPHTGWKFVEL